MCGLGKRVWQLHVEQAPCEREMPRNSYTLSFKLKTAAKRMVTLSSRCVGQQLHTHHAHCQFLSVAKVFHSPLVSTKTYKCDAFALHSPSHTAASLVCTW